MEGLSFGHGGVSFTWVRLHSHRPRNYAQHGERTRVESFEFTRHLHGEEGTDAEKDDMSADFWSGYVSGALGILVGNPLDLIKTRLQVGTAGQDHSAQKWISVGHIAQVPVSKQFEHWTALARGAAAPILGYGALNALLFVTYNRSLALLNTGKLDDWPQRPSAWSIWTSGALGGLAIFFVSAPTELVKCRAQVSNPPQSSLEVTKELWRRGGLRGMYLGGAVTSIRDSVGYGF